LWKESCLSYRKAVLSGRPDFVRRHIYREFHIRNQVFLASQSGRDLIDPWVKVIVVPVGIPNEIVYKIEQKANRFIKKIPLLTEKLVAGTFQLA